MSLRERLAAAQAVPDDAVPLPRWPFCHRCGRTALPGLECEAVRCPWQREDGAIVRLVIDRCGICRRRRFLRYVHRFWLCEGCWPRRTDKPWPGGERL